MGAGVWAWGPYTVPLACITCGGCVLWGWWGLPRGGWPATVVRGVWCQALSLPRPPVLWGGQPRFRDPFVPVRSLRVWGPITGPTARALAGWRCLPWGWRKGVPGGGAVHRCEGRLGSGAPPPPAAPPLGGLPGPTTHWLWVQGGAGVGTRHQPHSSRSCVLWGRHEGARGGAPPAWVWGTRGRALSQPRLPAL